MNTLNFCPHCGNKVSSEHKFCPACGKSFQESVAPTQPKLNSLNYLRRHGKQLKIAGLCLAIIIIVAAAYFIKTGSVNKLLSFNKISELPTSSVVKIVVNQGTDREASGSGLLFTADGYILTNAHVVSNELRKAQKDIKVCYTTKEREIKCDYDARFIDASDFYDLAVIKVDKKITEIKPYPLTIREESESWINNTLPLGMAITAVGYPGVGGNTVTVTRGIVSGYNNLEFFFDDGSVHNIPYFIKTDTEINFGNSGGAVFDAKNNFVGIPSLMQKDDGGKIGYVIYWNNINWYLNTLEYKGTLKLPSKQYQAAKHPKNEQDLWDGIKAFYRHDNTLAIEKLGSFTKNNPKDSRGWHYLCDTYLNQDSYEDIGKCAEQLRNSGDNALAYSWFLTSYYENFSGKDYSKAADAIDKALSLEPSSQNFLDYKSLYETNLGHMTEAEATAKKSLDINPYDARAWSVKGIIAAYNKDFGNATQYLGYSFYLSPDAFVASVLSNAYWQQGQSPEDFQKSLQYDVAALVLDPKLEYIFPLTSKINYLFDSDTESTWQDSVKSMGGVLETIGVDKEILEPIAGISDEKIKEYDQSVNGTQEVSSAKIESYRFYIRAVVSWLYTFLDDKKMCAYDNQNISLADLNSILETLEVTQKTERTDFIYKYLVMGCLCETSGESDDALTACYAKKSAPLCGKSKVLNNDMECVNAAIKATPQAQQNASSATGYSEGWINMIGLYGGWAYDDGKPYEVVLTFQSATNPNFTFSVRSWSNKQEDGFKDGFGFSPRSDATNLIRSKGINTSEVMGFDFYIDSFMHNRTDIPKGRYRLIDATFNGKPFNFVNKVTKEVATAFCEFTDLDCLSKYGLLAQ